MAYSLQMILYMGIVLYAPAIALEAVTGMSKTSAILSIGNLVKKNQIPSQLPFF